MSDFERAAQAYATNGFRAFPLLPAGKRPLRRGWQSEATSDPAAVHELWQREPDANVGVLCGQGLIVLDADSPAAVDALSQLELPPTTSVRTRRGLHLYLAGDATNRVGLLPGVDVRGRGGYVVGAGSAHPRGGKYAWEVPPWEVPPATAPTALLRLVRTRANREPGCRGPIPEGRRNSTLTRLGGGLLRAQLGADGVLVALLAENAARCRPPLQRAEVENIARSVSRMQGPPPWAVDPLRFSEDPRLDGMARQVLHVLACRARHDGVVRGGEWVAEVTARHRNSVGQAIARIVEVGLMSVEHRHPRRAAVYRLRERANTELRGLPRPEESGTACTTGVQRAAPPPRTGA